MGSIQESVREHILCQILKTPDVQIGSEDDLLLTGVLDSISVMSLVSYLEVEHNIAIPAADILLENFGSLMAIEHYIQSRSVD